MIRFLEEYDVERIYEIYKYYIINTSITFEIEVPTLKEFRDRVNTISSIYPFIVYEVDNIVQGYAYATQYMERTACKWSVVSSIYLDELYQNKGVGKRLYKKLIDILKQQNFIMLYALITSANRFSLKFHENFGFTHIATMQNLGYKHGGWYDLSYYSYQLQEIDSTPEEIINITNIKRKIFP
ncbi:MAG: hypothetical protein BEN19_03565 [Epulopiscium sp. Nuni2H_MBin003]|nr:MAG: hypothetical protein BEN19_03565 [Epulopiscium sp. Nuni2H_MBin003]